MELSARVLADLEGSYRLVKTPAAAVGATARDGAVVERVSVISEYEGLAAHRATATIRLDRFHS
jgi:hypothetical protein